MQRRKVFFHITQDEDEYPPVTTESVWAVYKDGDHYIIDNTPFFARDATLDDVILACEVEGVLEFVQLISPSENSLLRVIYYGETDPSVIRQTLAQMGCSTEWFSEYKLISVNVPGNVSLDNVVSYLAKGFEQDQLDYEEAILRQERASRSKW